MIGSNLSICDVKEVLGRRYGITPVSIQPWINQTIFSLNPGNNQDIDYHWKLNKKFFQSGGYSDEKEFPLFVGSAFLNVYTVGTQAQTGGYELLIEGMNLESVGDFYILDVQQWKAYADNGVFPGPPLPTSRVNETMDNLNNPHSIIGPSIQVRIYTDATGTFDIKIAIHFTGYIIYLS